MDRNGPCKSRGSIILWIRKEEPSGGGVDGSRLLYYTLQYYLVSNDYDVRVSLDTVRYGNSQIDKA